MLVLADFLNRPYLIPFQEETPDLLDFIQDKEEEVLRGLLGTTLYDAYVAGISVGSPAQKWVDLRDGEDYTYSGVEYRFVGLDEILKPCIWALWVREMSERFTSAGVVQASPAQNSTYTGPARKISQAYSKFLSLVGDEYTVENTLYGYLLANSSDYEDWEFTRPESMNQFDL